MEKEAAKGKITELVRKFFIYEKEGKLSGMKEEDTKRVFIEPLFEALGWDLRNPEEVWENRSSAGGKRPDYAFRVEGVVRFFLEAKEVHAELTEQEAWQAINYSYNNSVPWALLTNFRELIIYNANWRAKKSEESRFLRFDASDYLNRFDDLWMLSKECIVSGEMEKKAETYGGKTRREPVTKALYSDLMRWRSMISKSVLRNDPRKKWTKELLDEAVQRYLNRLIFIRTCEDRKIENEQLRAALRQWREENKRKLRIYINNVMHDGFVEKYDSDIFFAHMAGEIPVEDTVLAQVIDELYESPTGAQYNFDAINADILGNIYEQYLATVLREGGSLVERESKRKEMGIYYTPTYIVDYIVKNTLGEIVAKTKSGEDLRKITVLDPACGSGSFLIRAFETLREAYAKKNGGDTQLLTENVSKNANDILTKNLYGVDLDIKAIEIVYLNLLLRAATQPGLLPMLSDNIKRGNSLISGTKEEMEAQFGPHWKEKKHPFNWEEEFKSVMDSGGFDVVVGNPPYLLLQPQNTEDGVLEYIKKNFTVAQYKIDDYHLFLERGISLLKDDGILGFITPNTYLMNIYTSNLRKYILNNCRILQIISIPLEVFPDASVDTSIIIVQKERNEKKRKENNTRILLVNNFKEAPSEIRTIKQETFFQNENSIFNIGASKKNTGVLEKISSDTSLLGSIARISFGLQTLSKDEYVKNKPAGAKWKPCIDGGDISRYSLKSNSQYFLHDVKIKAGGCWDEDTHNTPEKIVIRQIGKIPIAALDTSRYYSLNTIYNITSLKEEYNYKYVLGLINSRLIGFFWKMNFSDSKMLFPKVKKAYLDQIPIHLASLSDQQPIIKLVESMLEMNKRLVEMGETQSTDRRRLEEEIKRTDAKIDELVYKLYGITEEERKIIEESFEKK